MRTFFTTEQIKWLKKNSKGKLFKEITSLFNNRFNTDMSVSKISSRCRYYGIYTGMHGKGKSLPIGSERRWRKKGDIFVKVSNKHGGKWQLKHHYIWEQLHGKIPKGYSVIFLDKNRANYKPDNLELVSNTEKVHLGSLDLWFDDKEMTKCGLAVVKHNLMIHRKLSKKLGKKEHKRFRVRHCREKTKRRVS